MNSRLPLSAIWPRTIRISSAAALLLILTLASWSQKPQTNPLAMTKAYAARFAQLGESLHVMVGKILAPVEPHVLRTDEPIVPVVAQRAVLVPPHHVHRVVHVHHDVESIEDDLRLRRRLLDGLDERRRQVHGHALELRTAFGPELVEEGLERGGIGPTHASGRQEGGRIAGRAGRICAAESA